MNPQDATKCVMIEVYLPVDVTNRTALIDTLLEAFELDTTTAELIGGPESEAIRHMPSLASFGTQEQQPIDLGTFIPALREALLGYSVHEVDRAIRSDGVRLLNSNKRTLSRQVSIGSSRPYDIPNHLARAFDSVDHDDRQQFREVEEARQRLRAHTKDFPPLCDSEPLPTNGPTFDVDLPDCGYILERVGSLSRPKVIATKYFRLHEERALVVRFLVSVAKIRFLRDGNSDIDTRMLQVFFLVGEYLVRNLRGRVAEGEVRIHNDASFLWRWEDGTAFGAAGLPA